MAVRNNAGWEWVERAAGGLLNGIATQTTAVIARRFGPIHVYVGGL